MVWTAALALALPVGAAAQAVPGGSADYGWAFTLVGEGGLFYSTRDVGKTTIVQPTGNPAQMRTETITSPTAAVGVEIASPHEALRFRVIGRTTLGGGARGQLIGCDILTDEEAGSACVEVESDGSIRTLTGGVMFIRRPTARDRLRPYLTLDAGARFFTYDDGSCGEEALGEREWIAAICDGQAIITEDQTRWVVEAGLGVRVDFGRASGYLHVLDAFGSYEVREGEAEGETQNAIVFSAGVAFPLGG